LGQDGDGKEIGEEMSMGCFDKLSTTPIPLPFPPFDRLRASWEGGWARDGCDDFPSQCFIRRCFGFSPLGETGEG